MKDTHITRTRRSGALVLVVAVAVSAIVAGIGSTACGGTSLDESPRPRQSTPTTPAEGDGTTTDINATGQGAGSGGNTGLPCDVQQLLENRCVGCHIATSPLLLTYEDLMKPGLNGQTVAARSLERMKDAARPMPPAPAVKPTAEEIGVFQAWVTAGAPRAPACTTGADGGVPATNPYNTPTVCTSKRHGEVRRAIRWIPVAHASRVTCARAPRSPLLAPSIQPHTNQTTAMA